MVERLSEGDIVLDIGSRGRESSYALRVQLATKGIRYVSLDIDPVAGVHVVGDANDLPIRDGSVDCVLCISVLEYIKNPLKAVSEMHRVLKPKGYLYLSAPFVYPYHPPPEDLFRFSPQGLCTLANGFDQLATGSNRGAASTFTHIFVHFMAISFSFGSRRAFGICLDIFKWSFFWIKYLDIILGRYESSKFLFGNAFFLGRKSTNMSR